MSCVLGRLVGQLHSVRAALIEAVIGHAAVIRSGAVTPPRSADVGPIIVITVRFQPPWGGIPPSAVVVPITAPPVMVSFVVRASNSHPPLGVSSRRMRSEAAAVLLRSEAAAMLRDARAEAALRCCSVFRCRSVSVFTATRAQPGCVCYPRRMVTSERS